jgi:hypothetical protein
LAFTGAARRTGAFLTRLLATFAAFLRTVGFVAGVFLRFTLALLLAFFLVAM